MLAKINIVSDFNDIEEKRKQILPTLGDNVLYEYNTWTCNKKRKNPSDTASAFTIYFANTPSQYLNLLKDYAVLSFSLNNELPGIINTVKRVKTFLQFIDDIGIPIEKINLAVVNEYEKFLADQKIKEVSKHEKWMATNNFFKVVKGYNGIPKRNYFMTKNPFERGEVRHDDKYIPKYIIKQMDNAFKNDDIPLYIRTVYWICRSIPNRIGETLGAKIDCIKPVKGDVWVIFLPTWKQNGGYKEPQIRRVYFKDTGHGHFLIQLIQEQQQIALSLQDGLKKDYMKNLLFTRKVTKIYNGTAYELSEPHITLQEAVRRAFNKVMDTYNIVDRDGKIYHFTTHQLRHNGITNRLYHGFTYMQTALLTGHQGEEMIQTAYNHPQKEELLEKQRSVHNEDDAPVYFRGRILNMDDTTEQRLLSNIRSRRIKNLGICSDFTGCKSFDCLACDSFIPDVDDLPYYQEQVRIFNERLLKVGQHQYLKENIKYNLSLYDKAIIKIERILKAETNNNEKTS